MARDWDYQTYWRNGQYICLLECCHRNGETLVSFYASSKYRFHEPELHQIALACIQKGEPLCALFDWLLEWCDRTEYRGRERLRERVEWAIQKWAEDEQLPDWMVEDLRREAGCGD